MAETNSPQRSTPNFHSLLAACDHPYPVTLTKPKLLLHTASPQPTPDTRNFSFERGPRYNLYSRIRESRLRAKRLEQQDHDQELEFHLPRLELTPPPSAKRTAFGFDPCFSHSKRSGRSSVLTQSLSLDFSPAASKKENRNPSMENVVMQSMTEKCFTPPLGIPKGSSRMYVSATSKQAVGGGGSQSVIAVGEKRGLMGRKSYASVEELKGLSTAAASAIAVESNQGSGRGGGRIGRMLEELNAAEKRSEGAMTRARKSFASFDQDIKGFARDNCQRNGGRVLRQDAVLGSSTRHW